MDDYIQVVAIATRMTNSKETEHRREVLESYEEPTEQDFNSCLPDQCALADQVTKTKTDILGLRKFIEAQSVQTDCHESVTFVGMSNTTIICNTGRVQCVFPQ